VDTTGFGEGSIEIQRHPGRRDKLREYKVILDGGFAGRIREGTSMLLKVKPGPHSLQLRIDWCGSRKGIVDVKVSTTTVISCRSGSGLSFWDALFRRNNYVDVSPPDEELPDAPTGWELALFLRIGIVAAAVIASVTITTLLNARLYVVMGTAMLVWIIGVLSPIPRRKRVSKPQH
jgi:hypothetical protein